MCPLWHRIHGLTCVGVWKVDCFDFDDFHGWSPLLCTFRVSFCSNATWLFDCFGVSEDSLSSLSVLEPCHYEEQDKSTQVFYMRPFQATWSHLCESSQWRATQLPSWHTVICNHVIKASWNHKHYPANHEFMSNNKYLQDGSIISIFIPMTLTFNPPSKWDTATMFKHQNLKKCINLH